MRRNLVLLTAACIWAVASGCASKAKQEPPTVLTDRACANDFLRASATSPDTKPDPQIESILTQPTDDGRLMEINRRMYESLHALDVELRRENRIAACEQPTLEARSDSERSVSRGAASTGGLSGSVAGAASSSTSGGAAPVQSAMSAGAPRGTTLRNTSRTASGGGGNGATAPKITPGSDNDVVARRLRKAAEQESNPTLRAKLWKEYTDYIHGTSAN